MTAFAEHFCLKNGRDNFFVKEPEDSHLILGSKKYKTIVDDMLDAAIASQRPPRLVWVGDFGAGKTHYLNYTDRKITDAGMPFKVVRMELPDVVDNSEFSVLFERMMTEIGMEYFRDLLKDHISAEPKWLDSIMPLDIQTALRQVAVNPVVAELAWDFLCGRKLAKDEKARVGVSNLQLDNSEAYASVLQHVSRVIRERTEGGKVLLYLVDEVEGLDKVSKPNAQHKWVLALRKILDINDIGIILAIGAQGLHGIPEIVTKGEIMRRIGEQQYILLEPYDVNQAKSFIQELFIEFVDQDKLKVVEKSEDLTSVPGYMRSSFPFTEEALEAYCTNLLADSDRAKPAQFLHRLHATLSAALKEGKHVIDRSFLESRDEWQ